MSNFTHFKGKNPLEHVLDARIRGNIASSEEHGLETKGYVKDAIFALKETTAVILLLGISFYTLQISYEHTLYISLFFFVGWIIWNMGRSAFLGWWRLQKLNKLIEEEKWEITHHRDQEKTELESLYKAKGFSGKLLQEVVEVLMADDNRLLQIMLEEEMGIVLSSFEHPLKHALGAGVGACISAIVLGCCIIFLPFYALVVSSFSLVFFCVFIMAKSEKLEALSSTIWALGILALSGAFTYFIAQGLRTIL